MFPHEVTLEAYKGSGAYKPIFDVPLSVRCLYVGDVKLVRDPQRGEETVSSAQVYCQPGLEAPENSRVTCPDGTVRTVMRTSTYDPGTLPVPGSVVIYLE